MDALKEQMGSIPGFIGITITSLSRKYCTPAMREVKDKLFYDFYRVPSRKMFAKSHHDYSCYQNTG